MVRDRGTERKVQELVLAAGTAPLSPKGQGQERLPDEEEKVTQTRSPGRALLRGIMTCLGTQPVHQEETREINILSLPSSLLPTYPCPHWLHPI